MGIARRYPERRWISGGDTIEKVDHRYPPVFRHTLDQERDVLELIIRADRVQLWNDRNAQVDVFSPAKSHQLSEGALTCHPTRCPVLVKTTVVVPVVRAQMEQSEYLIPERTHEDVQTRSLRQPTCFLPRRRLGIVDEEREDDHVGPVQSTALLEISNLLSCIVVAHARIDHLEVRRPSRRRLLVQLVLEKFGEGFLLLHAPPEGNRIAENEYAESIPRLRDAEFAVTQPSRVDLDRYT